MLFYIQGLSLCVECAKIMTFQEGRCSIPLVKTADVWHTSSLIVRAAQNIVLCT